MKVAWSVLVGDARGKCGSITASLGRSGARLSKAFRTARPASELQLEAQGAFGSLTQFWANPAMAPYRGGWVTLALTHQELNIFNLAIYKTGHQWFVRANRNRQFISEDIILEAPAWAAVDDPGALTLDHVIGPPEHLNLTATFDPAAGDAVVIYATPPLSPGRLCLGHQQRKLGIINPATDSPWDILTDYVAKFGTPASGRQVFVEAYYMDIAQGRIGLKLRAACLW